MSSHVPLIKKYCVESAAKKFALRIARLHFACGSIMLGTA